MEKKPLKFIHISKNAGTSIEDAGRKINLKWGMYHKEYFPDNISPHFWHHTILSKLNRQIVDKYDWFMVVRNPYDRLLSEYYCIYGGIGNTNIKHSKEQMNQYLIDKINNRSPIGNHYTEQYKYLLDGVKITILKFENLEMEFNDLMKIYKLETSFLQRKNMRNLNKYKETTFSVTDFSKELIELINRIYSDDFELFDYKKICYSEEKTKKCASKNCIYKVHTDIKNNGGDYCCVYCKTSGQEHGSYCEKNIYNFFQNKIIYQENLLTLM